MMSPQYHKNIIFHPNFISNHIFLITFVKNNEIKVTLFFELFDEFPNYKKKAFGFGNYLLSLVKKYTEMVLVKKYSYFRLVKTSPEIGQNIYDVDNK